MLFYQNYRNLNELFKLQIHKNAPTHLNQRLQKENTFSKQRHDGDSLSYCKCNVLSICEILDDMIYLRRNISEILSSDSYLVSTVHSQN